MSKPNPIQIFFWSCAGSTISILKRQETEYPKHTVLGVAVCLVSVIALFTGLSAFLICFPDQKGLSIAAGFVWAVIIFNIDRSFIVSANSQSGRLSIGILFCTRLVMAILISLSLSTIFELKLFESTINKELKDIYIENIQKSREKEVANIKDRIKIAQQDEQAAKKTYNAELRQQKDLVKLMKSSTRGQAKITIIESAEGANNNVKKFSDSYLKKVGLVETLNNDLKTKESKLTIDAIENNNKSEIEALPEKAGLIDRYEALNKIAEKRKVHDIRYAITAIFAMIEISPLLIKTMYIKGDYEDMIKSRSNQEKEKYTKELTSDKNRFEKIIKITNERLALNEEYADSKLHPSDLRLSNNLISTSEDNLRLSSDSEKSKDFILYTAAEKNERQEKASQSKNGGIFQEIQHQLDELVKKINEMEPNTKRGFALAGIISGLALWGGAAKNIQDIGGLLDKLLIMLNLR